MSNLILFAGGGTGGHLFPGIALAEALQQRQPLVRVLFVGSDREVERRIMAEHQYPHVALPLSPLGQLWRQPGRFLWRNWRAVTQARQIIRDERPQAVIGLGGLTSAPVVWAAHRAGVPVLLLEQNAIPGRATRWMAPCARLICVSFAECIEHLPKGIPALPCGNPVRAHIRRLANECKESESVHDKTLLVLGGSQGAESLNATVVELIRQQRSGLADWTIVHQTGPRQADAIRATYEHLGQRHVVADFFPDVADCYRQADIVISRAGATTLAELACAGKPMVLVPYPHAADNHQLANAKAFARHGAAAVVTQAETDSHMAANLWSAIEPWLANVELRERIGSAARSLARPDAVDRILGLLFETLRIAA
jgi:UDP-N-acetylglucosamine--N-acetylmuramyl-(pentapeptide) pyrophosphoryl-undecaprenol N-acetylglucosamine transferase